MASLARLWRRTWYAQPPGAVGTMYGSGWRLEYSSASPSAISRSMRSGSCTCRYCSNAARHFSPCGWVRRAPTALSSASARGKAGGRGLREWQGPSSCLVRFAAHIWLNSPPVCSVAAPGASRRPRGRTYSSRKRGASLRLTCLQRRTQPAPGRRARAARSMARRAARASANTPSSSALGPGCEGGGVWLKHARAARPRGANSPRRPKAGVPGGLRLGRPAAWPHAPPPPSRRRRP